MIQSLSLPNHPGVAADILHQKLRDPSNADGATILSMFRLLCAYRLLELADHCQEAEITPGGLGVLLVATGQWYGYIQALDMIDSDIALKLVKQVYHGEVAKQHRAMREPRQEEEMAVLVKVLRRKLKNTGKSVYDCAKDTFRHHSKSVLFSS